MLENSCCVEIMDEWVMVGGCVEVLIDGVDFFDESIGCGVD